MNSRLLSYPDGIRAEVERMTGYTPPDITLQTWVLNGRSGEFLRISRQIGNKSFVTAAELHRFARAWAKARKCVFSAWAAKNGGGS